MSVKDLKAEKNEIRSKYKKQRESFSREKKAELDEKIAQRFLNLPEYKECLTLLAFISKDIEVDTKRIIDAAFSDKKTVAVPKCSNETTIIEFFEIKSYDDLEKGFYGLMEPKEGCTKIEDFSSAVCIVPGLVYDRNGYRLGFGKGFYDRFLTNFNGAAVGVCYSLCIEPELPRGYYDRPTSMVVTDKYTIDTEIIKRGLE